MSVAAALPRPAGPRGPRPRRLGPERVGLYAFLVVAAAFFLLPAYVMVLTSLKTMDEIRQGAIFAWPDRLDLRCLGGRLVARPARA